MKLKAIRARATRLRFAGEGITAQSRDFKADEIPDLLHAVTSGCGTRELSLTEC